MPFKVIDAKTLKELTDNNNAIIIDVREPYEYLQANIPNSILIPLAAITLNVLPENPEEKKIVMLCHAGVRSARACEIILAKNPDIEIYNLAGGILAWNDSGYALNIGTNTTA